MRPVWPRFAAMLLGAWSAASFADDGIDLRTPALAARCASVVVVKCPAAEAGPRLRDLAGGADASKPLDGLRDSYEKLQTSRLTAELFLDRVIIYGQRTRKPTISEAFSHLTPPYGGSVRFETVDIGDGRRCTRMLPYGYSVCSPKNDRFPAQIGPSFGH